MMTAAEQYMEQFEEFNAYDLDDLGFGGDEKVHYIRWNENGSTTIAFENSCDEGFYVRTVPSGYEHGTEEWADVDLGLEDDHYWTLEELVTREFGFAREAVAAGVPLEDIFA